MSIETNLKDVVGKSTNAAIKEFMSAPATREEVQASIRQLEANIIMAISNNPMAYAYRNPTQLESVFKSLLDRIAKLEQHLVRTTAETVFSQAIRAGGRPHARGDGGRTGCHCDTCEEGK